MDTTKAITHISLCAGYGGIDIGLSRAIPNLRTIVFSEIEAFAAANLVSKMEAGLLDCAPIWTNLKTLPWDGFLGKVDIISGGFPCQPFSCAGKRDGDEDPRHLFPYILDGIRRCRPSIVFLENVEGILSAKLSGENWRDPAGTPVLLHVIRELERVGYKATAGIFSASEVGAPHQRKRVFIMAYSSESDARKIGWPTNGGWECWEGNTKRTSVELAYRKCEGLEGLREFSSSLCRTDKGLQLGDGNSREELAHSNSRGTLGSGYKLGDPSEVGQGGANTEEDCNGQPTSRVWPSRPSHPQFAWEPPRVVGDTKERGCAKSGPHELQAGIDATPWDSSGETGVVGNAECILLSAPREHGVMAEEGGYATAEGSQPPQACAESSATREREGRGGDASEFSQTQPSLGGDPYGASNRVGHAELCESDNADCRAESESGGQLDDTRGTEQHGIPSQQRQEDPASWESSDSSKLGNTEYAGSYGAEIGRSLDSSSANESSREIQTIEPSGASESKCGEDLLNYHLYTTCDNRTDELRLLGNGVVPATAELAFRTLWEELNQTN